VTSRLQVRRVTVRLPSHTHRSRTSEIQLESLGSVKAPPPSGVRSKAPAEIELYASLP